MVLADSNMKRNPNEFGTDVPEDSKFHKSTSDI